jgi:hypothetical protein
LNGGDEDEAFEEEMEEYLIDPKNPATSPKVTSLTAISLLHKYIQVRIIDLEH